MRGGNSGGAGNFWAKTYPRNVSMANSRYFGLPARRLDPRPHASDLRRVNVTLMPMRRLGLFALLAALGPCADQKEGLDPTTSRPAPSDGYRRAAYISVSNESPRVGDTVIV